MEMLCPVRPLYNDGLHRAQAKISPALDFSHLFQYTYWMSDKHDKHFLPVPFQVWMEKIAAKGSQEGLSTYSK